MIEGRILGDYQLIKQIGQGTLGTVFLAEHRFMKKQYIVKILPEELSSDRSFIQRFEEEIGILSTLEHPHIVKVHYVSFAQGQYFLVMDCIVDDLGETTNLAQYMQAHRHQLEEEEIFQFLSQIGEALSFAHSKKIGNSKEIVHRNIKLNNILVGQGTKGNIHLYLSDFGLSRIIGTGAILTRMYKNIAEALAISSMTTASKTGQERYPNPPLDLQKITPLHSSFLQTFAFLAPEQKRLDSHHQVDAKADMYAFGVLAYYLLMGEYPEGFFEMPSTQKKELQLQWDSLICACLKRDPNQRPDCLISCLNAVRKKSDQYFIEESIDCTEDHLYTGNSSSHLIQSMQKVIGQPDSDSNSLRPIIHVAQLERPKSDPDPASIFNIDTTVKHYQPERKEIQNILPILTDMVVIKGGVFYRGSNEGNRDEMPRHAITLNSFAIDIHPVTNEQFVRFLEAMGGEKDNNHHDIIRMKESRIKRSGGKLSIESGYTKHPVVGITWYGAIAYAKWIGKRLLTEAEWEVASRGGLENALYPTGDDIEKSQANFFSSDTTAVMSYPSNGYGLYDMGGNVYEWCHDWYGYNYYELSVQEPENPKGPLQGVYRVLRGGCWKSLKEDLRCSHRHRNNPGTVNGTYGFRCAADVQ